jgi:hypothetical protein
MPLCDWVTAHHGFVLLLGFTGFDEQDSLVWTQLCPPRVHSYWYAGWWYWDMVQSL